MNEDPRYTMVIQWSVEDDTFVVSFPDWDGIVSNPVTHGDTYTEAVRAGEEAIEAMMASNRKHNQAMPVRRAVTTTVSAA